MIRAVIVEDSRLARLELRELLKDFPQVEVIAEANTAEQAVTIIDAERPDLIFLDIHLPGKNGFDVLAELRWLPAVIFTTAFDQYALQSFEYNTLDYLLKPISSDRLAKAVAKAETYLQRTPDHAARKLFVRDRNKAWLIPVDRIRLLESKGNYTQIHFDEHAPLMLKALNQFESMLDPGKFIRANRSQAINLDFVSGSASRLGGRLKLRLTTGEEIEVSRRQANRLKGLLDT